MDSNNFIDIIKNNSPEQMMEFLLSNGKGPKPFCPFSFISEEEVANERERINETSNIGD